MPGDTNLDSASVAIALGDSVKILGTVTAINLVDPRFNDITVTLTSPVKTNPLPGVTPNDGEVGNRLVIKLPASVLTKV